MQLVKLWIRKKMRRRSMRGNPTTPKKERLSLVFSMHVIYSLVRLPGSHDEHFQPAELPEMPSIGIVTKPRELNATVITERHTTLLVSLYRS